MTGDLDPIYLALNRCAFDSITRNKWLTAYCAFYNAGFACMASELAGKEFWGLLMQAAVNEEPTPFGERWPRASERRHFRGIQAIKAIQDWENKYPENPELMMEYIASAAPSFKGVLQNAQEHRSIGTWMSFKLVDLVDACMNAPIDQADITMFFYDTPKKSLLRLWREKQGFNDNVVPKNELQVLEAMVEYLAEVFHSFAIPHKPTKQVDMFTLETIACKHLSHLNGHYPLYNDIDEITEGLAKWIPYSSNAQLLNRNMPRHL